MKEHKGRGQSLVILRSRQKQVLLREVQLMRDLNDSWDGLNDCRSQHRHEESLWKHFDSLDWRYWEHNKSKRERPNKKNQFSKHCKVKKKKNNLTAVNWAKKLDEQTIIHFQSSAHSLIIWRQINAQYPLAKYERVPNPSPSRLSWVSKEVESDSLQWQV